MNSIGKLRFYKKSLDYSYSIGVFPTIELLTQLPEMVQKVVLSSKSSKNAGVAKIRDLCGKKTIKIEESDKFIKKNSGKENCYAIGVFNKYERNITPGKNHLLLAGIRDMGNLGTICRTMLGFNMTNLAIIKPAADIFNPKVVRASMGSLFQLNFQYFEGYNEYQRKFSNTPYPFITDGKEELANVSFNEPYTLIFGSEAAGLDESFKETGTSVRIPQGTRVDSLNLSVAVGIALYESQKQISTPR
jgi:TrmH family RNA methyltransferase